DHTPEIFINDDLLNQWYCPINQKPIRFILVVDGTQERDEPVYYEKSIITNWIKEHPEQNPPKWPEDIMLSSENLKNANSVQRLINTRLEILLNGFRGETKTS